VLSGSDVVYTNGQSEVLYTRAPQMARRNVAQR
jgi:hypothetical protein